MIENLSDEKTYHEFIILVVGDINTGKSSLIKRFVEDTFYD
jgi:GTPase SAR1 family protein